MPLWTVLPPKDVMVSIRCAISGASLAWQLCFRVRDGSYPGTPLTVTDIETRARLVG